MASSLFLVIVVSALFRWQVSLWGYSGQGKPPMFGDYEAQRHWMEITTNIPIGDWYRQTSDNDLQYWGLDYPPLTAYVSWFFGQLSKALCPELVQLHISRGIESQTTKVFMRLSVLYSDIMVIVPVISVIVPIFIRRPTLLPEYYFLIQLVNPSLLLIDHGHFQYNGVCIGLSLLAGYFIIIDKDVVGSILFVLALNFKQMALYYSLIFFCVLLRKSIIQPTIIGKFTKLFSIGLAVIVTFIVMWFPFCLFPGENETCTSSIKHLFVRLFPFNRGVFEDKVASIWYTISIIYDVRQNVSIDSLKLWCLGLTLLLISPTLIILLSRKLSPFRMILGLMNAALAFFLASYHVHEKTILLALIPASLLMNFDPLLFSMFQIIGVFSMFPLLVRDGLRIPYFCVVVIYGCLLIGYYSVAGPFPNSVSPAFIILFRRLAAVVSLLGMVVLHILEVTVKPPERYPDLYPALFSLYSFLHFLVMYFSGVYYLYLFKDQHERDRSRKAQQRQDVISPKYMEDNPMHGRKKKAVVGQETMRVSDPIEGVKNNSIEIVDNPEMSINTVDGIGLSFEVDDIHEKDE